MPLTWTAVLGELRRADLLISVSGPAVDLSGIGVDSRTIAKGMLYVAVRGSQSDGHRFLGQAVSRGAAAVVVETPQQLGVPEILVSDSRRSAIALGAACGSVFSAPRAQVNRPNPAADQPLPDPLGLFERDPKDK